MSIQKNKKSKKNMMNLWGFLLPDEHFVKHRKILDGLRKLPENRECADCKRIDPRWASIEFGIFICIDCARIHDDYISEVQSATIDTWLPEEVAFIQSMGNGRSNSYWEAELPSNYNRVKIEKFIRAKYNKKRWVSKCVKRRSRKAQGVSDNTDQNRHMDSRKRDEDAAPSDVSKSMFGGMDPEDIADLQSYQDFKSESDTELLFMIILIILVVMVVFMCCLLLAFAPSDDVFSVTSPDPIFLFPT